MAEQLFIGTKIVSAEPMDEWAFIKAHKPPGSTFPARNQEGYRVRYRDGYISWCPKEQFEHANRPISAEEFGMFQDFLFAQANPFGGKPISFDSSAAIDEEVAALPAKE